MTASKNENVFGNVRLRSAKDAQGRIDESRGLLRATQTLMTIFSWSGGRFLENRCISTKKEREREKKRDIRTNEDKKGRIILLFMVLFSLSF